MFSSIGCTISINEKVIIDVNKALQFALCHRTRLTVSEGYIRFFQTAVSDTRHFHGSHINKELFP